MKPLVLFIIETPTQTQAQRHSHWGVNNASECACVIVLFFSSRLRLCTSLHTRKFVKQEYKVLKVVLTHSHTKVKYSDFFEFFQTMYFKTEKNLFKDFLPHN